MTEQEFAELAAGHALNALSHEDEAQYWEALAAHPEWEHVVRADAATAAALAEGVAPVAPPLTARSMLLVRVAALAREQGAPAGAGVGEATAGDATAGDATAGAGGLAAGEPPAAGAGGPAATAAVTAADPPAAPAAAPASPPGAAAAGLGDGDVADADAADAGASDADAADTDATQVVGEARAGQDTHEDSLDGGDAAQVSETAEAPTSPDTDTTPTTMTGLFRWATVDTSSAPVQPASSSQGVDEPPTTTAVQATMRRRWTRGLIALAASLTLLVGVGFGAGVVHTWLNRPASVVALDEIKDAPDARSATVVMDGGLTATAYWSAERGEAVLVSEGLPSIPEDETFEMWVIRDDEPLSAGTFLPEAGSQATTVIDGEVQPGDVIAITVEPAGGAPEGVPTSDPIVAVPTA
ncbi:anti-sigma factor [Microbacterium sp. zg.Y909]|uniref:anti-sigma factor n=1 Tax=Microbacterium sp. zg.Y909 TaxID=2969413 RepID=UPI00214B7622|nr:anti-sigma factor [Microbacterium sp. zg.Y909]MCR2827341.1 anti-sigma factor [Microbacterium sp. zg.Y909]